MADNNTEELQKRLDRARTKGFISHVAALGKSAEETKKWHAAYKTQSEKRKEVRDKKNGKLREALLGKK